LRDCFPDLSLHRDLIGAHRSLDLERRHPGVLAYRALVFTCHVNVGRDHVQRSRGAGRRLFRLDSLSHGAPHIRRQIRRRLRYELLHAFFERLHHLTPICLLTPLTPHHSSLITHHSSLFTLHSHHIIPSFCAGRHSHCPTSSTPVRAALRGRPGSASRELFPEEVIPALSENWTLHVGDC